MSTLIRSVALPDARRDALRFGIAAILLEALFIGVTGFAPLQAIHDAAHNTRHAISFSLSLTALTCFAGFLPLRSAPASVSACVSPHSSTSRWCR